MHTVIQVYNFVAYEKKYLCGFQSEKILILDNYETKYLILVNLHARKMDILAQCVRLGRKCCTQQKDSRLIVRKWLYCASLDA